MIYNHKYLIIEFTKTQTQQEIKNQIEKHLSDTRKLGYEIIACNLQPLDNGMRYFANIKKG